MANTFGEQSGGGISTGAQKLSTVRYGVYSNTGNYAGKTVAQVRTELSHLWNVPNDAVGYRGKEKMADDYVLQPEDTIEFHRRSGEKGCV